MAGSNPYHAFGTQNAAKLREALGTAECIPPAPKPPVAPYRHPDAPDLELTPPDDKAQRRNAQIEWQEQCRYFEYVNDAIRQAWDGADMIFAITNSNVAGKAIGGKLVAAGLRRGYPDIAIDVPRPDAFGHVRHGARIELKTPQGSHSDVGDHQHEWIRRLNERGYVAVVCFGYLEAMRFTARYLGWERLP